MRANVTPAATVEIVNKGGPTDLPHKLWCGKRGGGFKLKIRGESGVVQVDGLAEAAGRAASRAETTRLATASRVSKAMIPWEITQ